MVQQIDDSPVELQVSAEKVCYLIAKAREYDAKVAPVEEDPGSNPTDSGDREILEDFADDPTAFELRAALDTLDEDEAVDVIAMVWIGRGDFAGSELPEARTLAAERHRRKAANYLMGMPNFGDLLEEGLSLLGHSCEEFEIDRL